MSDLPHSNAGYIQSEETDFTRAIDKLVFKKFGKNQNYLKDQADTAQALALTVFASVYKVAFINTAVTLNGSGYYSGIVAETPNGKPILCATAMSNMGDNRTPSPIICIGPQVKGPYYGGNGASGPTTFPFNTGFEMLLGVQIVGANNNQLYASVEPSSLGGAPYVGSIRCSLIYPL